MSGLELVAAVSAVVDAFHGAAELLDHVKKNRRNHRSRSRNQEPADLQVQQLQDSLLAAERSIGLRYNQDLKELGHFVRIGDATTRDRLLHIARLMHAEIIDRLQLAVTQHSAILNVKILHQASLSHTKDTLDTLDELKQRIIMTRPMARHLQSGPGNPATRQAGGFMQPGQSNAHNRAQSILDDYIAASVALPTREEAPNARLNLAELLRQKRKDSTQTMSSSPASPSSLEASQQFSEALERLIRSRSTEDREVIMKDIDVMISTYQDLKVSEASRDSWDQPGNRDTLMWLAGEDSYKQDPVIAKQAQAFQTRSLPPTPKDIPGNLSNHPAFKNSFNDSHQEQPRYQQQFAKPAFSHLQSPEMLSRWSHGSAGSDYSEANSTNRISSNSSQSSNPRSPLTSSYFPPRPMYNGSSHLSTPPTVPYQEPPQHQDYRRIHSQPTPPYAMPQRPHSPARTSPRPEYQPNIRPSTAPRLEIPNGQHKSLEESVSPTHMPWPHRTDSPPVVAPQFPMPPQHFEQIIQQDGAKDAKSKPRYNLMPSIGRKAASIHSNKGERSPIGPILSPLPPPSLPSPSLHSSADTIKSSRLKHASVATSVSSSNSSVTGGLGVLPGSRMRNNNNLIRTDTIQSGPPSEKQILDGRPCKDNNYWGFCKGSWTIREDQKKGLSLRTLPSGYYNQKQVWQCSQCDFKGESMMRPHPTKKNKMEPCVDPRVQISMAGIRYRWMFLAKSHVKKKGNPTEGQEDETHFCCMFCTSDGILSSTYGGVETLMNHIALNHVADMSELTRKKTNCIIGRTAAANEVFDINIPVFSQNDDGASSMGDT